MARVKPFRDAYLAKHFLCEVCERRKSVDVHEILRGPYREKALDKEFAVLAVCRTCHRALENYAKWPISRALCLKLLRSPELFGVSFDNVNKLRGNSDTEFTPADILWHAELRTA